MAFAAPAKLTPANASVRVMSNDQSDLDSFLTVTILLLCEGFSNTGGASVESGPCCAKVTGSTGSPVRGPRQRRISPVME